MALNQEVVINIIWEGSVHYMIERMTSRYHVKISLKPKA